MLARALFLKNMTAQEALREGVAALQRARIESASLDARLLLEHALGIGREQLLFRMNDVLTGAQQSRYRELIAARAERRPVAQIVGRREFWGMEFKVTEDTLDPRPDSETLIEAVLERLPQRGAKLSILDLGAGTGCLLLALLKELPGARGLGVDASDAALAVAKENARNLGLDARAEFAPSRWFENVEGNFDVIISNPPYIPRGDIAALAPEVSRFEPKLALDGGNDGLDAYRAILAALPAFLASGGFAVLEIGMGQEKDVEKIAAVGGLRAAGMKNDLSGITRCLIINHERN